MDGFWLTDTKGKLIEINEFYCAMSGYSEEELLKMCIENILMKLRAILLRQRESIRLW